MNENSITHVHNTIKGQSRSIQEIVQEYVDKIEKYNTEYNILTSPVDDVEIQKQTKYAQELFDKGKETLLTGIPYTAKDVFVTTGVPTTAGSQILKDYHAPYEATVISLLQKQGAILIGKTNCDAFGFGSSTEHSDFGPTKNPWDKSRTPGGSSGGSAAAVALGLGLFSIAEDTGGSIRQPAAFCNVVGIKPTYGRVSRYGSIAYASSLDSVGIIASTVQDTAIVLEQIAGFDENDATSLRAPVPSYSKMLNKPNKLTIGIPKEFINDSQLDTNIKDAIESAASVFESLGFTVREVSLPLTKYAVATYYILATSEASSNLARYDGIRYGYCASSESQENDIYTATRTKVFNKEVKRRIMLGTFALSAGYYDAFYKKALGLRDAMFSEYDKVFSKIDCLLAPVSPVLPFQFGEKESDPLTMWLADAYTTPVNLAGIPALALPAGFSQSLPVGMQLIGPKNSEHNLFALGSTYQQETDWHNKLPLL